MELRRAFLTMFFAAGHALGADLQGWQILEALVRPHPRAELLVHSRIQSVRHLQTLQQIRLGPTVRLLLHEKAIPFVSFYDPVHEPFPNRLHAGQRFLAGVESGWRLRREAVFTSRIGFDRIFSGTRPDFNRYRSFARVTWNRPVSPLIQNEVFLVRQGFHSARAGAGIRWRLGRHATLDTAYFYDVRASAWGGSRAWILTTLRVHPARP